MTRKTLVEIATRMGHPNPQRSTDQLKQWLNQRGVDVGEVPSIDRRIGERAIRKRRWDQANRWRQYDLCSCGNYKTKRAKTCRACVKSPFTR